MNLYNDRIRSRLNKAPVVKRAVKFALKGLLARQDEKTAAIFNRWLKSKELNQASLERQRTEAKYLKYKPLISVVVPIYNTPTVYFHEMVDSVRRQTYDNWELILVDDASPDATVRVLINQVAEMDSRIKKLFLKKNHHISGATNEAIKASSGEFVSLFDHDDLLREDALFEIVKALNDNHNLDFIYTDEAKINEEGTEYTDLFFKPDWNPDMLSSINYITHFTTIRRSLLDEKGYLDKAYDGAQDWELFLRLTRDMPEERVFHMPKMLYSWRVHGASTAKSLDTKPYVIESQRKAIEGNLRARGYKNFVLQQDSTYNAQWQVIFKPTSKPKVSLLSINDEKIEQIKKYIAANTSYKNYEVLSVTKDSRIKELQKVMSGEYIIILGKNIKIYDQNWIELLLGDAQRSDIGFVVSRYGDDRDLKRSITDLLKEPEASFVNRMSVRALSKHFYTTTRYNIRTVGNATMMVEMRKLREVINDNDIKLDVARLSNVMMLRGHRNLYNPYIKMVK
jgi:glycosyltransferase involved in cell wall biosynthesis